MGRAPVLQGKYEKAIEKRMLGSNRLGISLEYYVSMTSDQRHRDRKFNLNEVNFIFVVLQAKIVCCLFSVIYVYVDIYIVVIIFFISYIYFGTLNMTPETEKFNKQKYCVCVFVLLFLPFHSFKYNFVNTNVLDCIDCVWWRFFFFVNSKSKYCYFWSLFSLFIYV